MKRGRRFLAVLSTITLSLPLFIMPVYAEYDYEFYYPDQESYLAYEYFINHGYTNLILSSSGNQSVTYNVNLTNNNDLTQSAYDTGTITGTETTTGTINSTASTLGAKYMTCTTNNAVSGTQTYSCYFSSRSNAVENSQSITLKLNENTSTSVNDRFDIGTINEDGTTTGTISSSMAYSNRLYAKIPKLTGTYIHPSEYSNTDFLIGGGDNPAYIIFMAATTKNGQNYNVYTNSGEVNTEVTATTLGAGWKLFIYKFSGSSNVTVDFTWLTNEDVIPIYVGRYNMMPDSIRQRVGIDTETVTQLKKLNDLTENGNTNSNSAANNADNKNSDLNSKVTQFDTLENDSITDMNNSINSLDLSNTLINDYKFIYAAQWVKTQFDRMTVSTPIGSVLSFSLILGITLIFMGKIR